MTEKVQVSNHCGVALADRFGLNFFETSAKIGTNVEEVFNHLAKSLDLMHQIGEQAENEALSKMQIEAVNSSVINDDVDDCHDTFEATTTTPNATTLPKKSFCLLS